MKMLNEWKLNSNDLRSRGGLHVVTTVLILNKHPECKSFNQITIRR